MPIVNCSHTSFSGDVLLPASKSISNRLLIINELSGGLVQIKNLSTTDDTRLMQQCLSDYKSSDHLYTANAGTVMRFITALLATKEGQWMIEGSTRMHERPIGPLVRALQTLGADISFIEKNGFPPLKICGKKLHGGRVHVDAFISSQFISALILIAPGLKDGLVIELTGTIQSGPYIDMTLALIEQCGIRVERIGRTISVMPSEYKATSVTVESDWSSAAFFYALAALSENVDIFLNGLTSQSIQGDSIAAQWFESLGVKTTYEANGVRLGKLFGRFAKLSLDFTGHPDLFLPMAVACAGMGTEFTATGLENLSLKESDRIKGAMEALSSLGYHVTYSKGVYHSASTKTRITKARLPLICVRDDHRMAMSFALLACRFPHIMLDQTMVVSKSFPGYFDALQQLGFSLFE